MNEQILIQHALKLLAECEYEKIDISLETLAEKLSLSIPQVKQALEDLRAAKLLERDQIALTPNGREYAMHVLQAHRLYETYLATKTGVPEASWHKLADAQEHKLTESDVEKLAEELGHPRFDPHGDPIPTKYGEMPEKQGSSLVDFPAGWTGKVVHIEDEPPRLYAHISNAGITPGSILRIDNKTESEMEIRIEGKSFTFPIEVVDQISVVDLAPGEEFDESIERLSSLLPNEQADITSLSPLCRGLERNRLLDLGIVPGSRVSVDLINPSGSPIAYRVRGACIALRLDQTERIRIRKVGK